MSCSSKKALAAPNVVIPASGSSCGSRPCQVPKLRSLRPAKIKADSRLYVLTGLLVKSVCSRRAHLIKEKGV